MDIKELLPQYGELNRIYQDIVEISCLSYKNQCFITDFYTKFKNDQSFETMVLNNLESENKTILLQSILIEIEKNIDLFKINKFLLENFNIYEVYLKHVNFFDKEIMTKEGSLRYFKDKYYKDNELLEGTSSPFSNYTDDEIKIITDNYFHSRKLYQTEVEPINELYILKKDRVELANGYLINKFPSVFDLSEIFLSILNKYISFNESPKNNSISNSPESKPKYFNSRLIYSIYDICNDNIFEKSSEENYNGFFNLQHNPIKLKKKERKLYYICFLIKFLSEFIDAKIKEIWIDEILKQLDICKKNEYEKRFNDVVTQKDAGNKKAAKFYNSLDAIKEFENQLNSSK